ncbi:MAG: trigger factor [Acidiferrobacterales bacterium]|nr:trigger factor [Acidiferrobacterales bacterium]
MQVTVEESGVIERKLTISVPSEEVTQEIEKRLRDVAKNARIPGFRPGKAPKNVIQKRYSNQVSNEVVSDKINASYQEALMEQKIAPAGLVSIEPVPFEDGKDLQYVATIELFPEIPTASLAGKSLEKPVCEVSDADVEKTLEDLRKRNAGFEEKTGKSAVGDRITIDFQGKIDGESFDGGSATDFPFVLGEGQMLEEFDTALVGTKAGETKTVEFTFPDDYHGEDVAGKDVVFSIDVKKVEEAELPALDDAFAETLGINEGGLEKMKDEIRQSLDRELAARLRSTMRDRVMDALHEANKIEVPKALVEEEIDRAVQTITQQLEGQGLPAKDIDRNNYADEARKRVALGLIAREVIEKSEIKVDGDAVRARIEEMGAGYDDSEAFVNYYYSDPQRLQQVEAIVLEEQVVNAMLETADVKEVKVDFREFMNPQAA